MIRPQQAVWLTRAGALLAACLLATTATADEPEWTKSISLDGWSWAASGEGVRAYERADEHAPPGKRRLWERYEFESPRKLPGGFTYLSQVALVEFDCNGRQGIITETNYADRNKAGDQLSGGPWESPPWVYIVPGSINDEMSQIACMPTPAQVEHNYRGMPRPKAR